MSLWRVTSDQLSTLEVVRQQSKAMQEIKESDVQVMLSAMVGIPDLDRNTLKDLLRGLVERITLNSQTLDVVFTTKSS